MSYVTLKNQKRISIMMIVTSLLLFLLFIRLFFIQILDLDNYKEKAYEQQTRERNISAKRGTIYDATGEKVLAQSVSVNIITAVPNSIDKEDKEKVAEKLAEILEKDKDEVLAKLNKNSSTEIIASKVNQEKAEQVLKYIEEEEVSGIRVDEDTLRVYPYKELLAQVLGFVGTDNQGLYGIESYYDDDLAGIPGKIVGSTDGKGRETPFTNEQYIAPIQGKDIVLTIDATIQGIVEKYLTKAVKENVAEYGMIVVLRPSTGEVLAMANYPTFDPNDPFTPYTDELKAKWDSLSKDERTQELYGMWRNKAISDTQEPGSTFKIVTATAALEENIVGIDDKVFNCQGSMKIGTWDIKCWRYYSPHGSESLREGILNSCNPVFMQVSQKMGIDTFCKYISAFNLDSKTGIDLPGEMPGIMHDPASMTAVDLATTSFGQTIQITTLQTAVNYAAVANGGYLVQPYVVKEIKSGSGNYDKKIESKVVKQIMSEKTASEVLSALEDTVTVGTGKSAKINGYRIAGKTATGENGRGDNTKYLAGFVGIAPVSSPEIVVMMNLYNPTGPSGHGGATLCGPVVGSIIDETLRYLEVPTDYTVEENTIKETIVPDLKGLTVSEARVQLLEQGFELAGDVVLNDEDIIQDQIPKNGASLMEGSVIRVYIDDSTKQTVAVPDVRNKTQSEAIEEFRKSGLNVRIVGSGYVLNQDVTPGEIIEKGSIITIKCVDTTELP
ncbi:MAG: penicillin-binding transpeptidase domain-containing protein [Clostridia bacterium]|nr:penicillin-binding transpeptidase domain-containing protein [Clostridia bacterium]